MSGGILLLQVLCTECIKPTVICVLLHNFPLELQTYLPLVIGNQQQNTLRLQKKVQISDLSERQLIDKQEL